ncbi:hypothetical protein Dimus_017323 [Dionaea muscipula]
MSPYPSFVNGFLPQGKTIVFPMEGPEKGFRSRRGESQMLRQAKSPHKVCMLCCQYLLRRLQTKPSYSNVHKDNSSQGYLHLYKSKGQHLLTNSRILDCIVKTSDIRPTDTVLEIGPGTGNLTLKLLEVARMVVAIEVDKRMVQVLKKRVAEHGFEDRITVRDVASVMCYDALKTEFPRVDLVVANIPYGISSPLVAKLVFGESPFRSATLLLQKEFARRLLADPGDSEYCRLAVNVKLVAEVEFVMDVSKRDFHPVPKVDSSVVRIRRKLEVPKVDFSEWSAFTRICFCKKNKTLGATFKQKKKLIDLMRMSKAVSLKKENVGIDRSSDISDEGELDNTENSNRNNETYGFSSTELGDFSCFKDKKMKLPLHSKGTRSEMLSLVWSSCPALKVSQYSYSLPLVIEAVKGFLPFFIIPDETIPKAWTQSFHVLEYIVANGPLTGVACMQANGQQRIQLSLILLKFSINNGAVFLNEHPN